MVPAPKNKSLENHLRPLFLIFRPFETKSCPRSLMNIENGYICEAQCLFGEFSDVKIVLSFFLFFENFEPRCSYKKE